MDEPERTAPPTGPDRYLSPSEVADLLRVNPKTVYREIAVGRLPALRVGRVLRVRVEDLRVLDEALGHPEPVERRRRRRREPVGEFSRRARGVPSQEDEAA